MSDKKAAPTKKPAAKKKTVKAEPQPTEEYMTHTIVSSLDGRSLQVRIKLIDPTEG